MRNPVMLKALELAGFKSFADRTRFEFPPGISAVVGPNGSGKSNVVDAVKWVLGSQSAKSLRGQEMIDVIFNGSPSRGPMGAAEATLTLNNDAQVLPVDAREVQITRRVYRSGEAEYLINRQPCRLRDIRDLLAGTGITTEAYYIIEQGKVDSLLQSSPRDRRVIFEEAAGISQFKAKKTAALRRLERVQQNLLRLSDIVDEVQNRLRSVRSQAGKARRYREFAARLQELRTQLGLADWRDLTEKIAAREQQLAVLAERQGQLEASLAQRELEAQQLERQLEQSLQARRGLELAASAAREQIAARQAAVESHRARRGELQQDVARLRRQLAAMNVRVGNNSQQLRDAAAELAAAEAELAAVRDQTQQQLELEVQNEAELAAARAAAERSRADEADAARSAATLADQLQTLAAQHTSLTAELEQIQAELTTVAQAHTERSVSLAEQQAAEAQLENRCARVEQERTIHEQTLAQFRRELARAVKQQHQLEARSTRTRERISVLTELEERLEGLDGGVQQLLKLAREDSEGPLRAVRGVVADLFHVDVDTAPLVEVALGERAQFLVLSAADSLLDHLCRGPLGATGRVGFLRLDTRSPLTALDQIDLSTEPGVMGRADRFIETAPEFAPLVQRLLGRTWLVDRLGTALRLLQGAGRGLDFVTSDGELLAADGTLIVGPRSAVIGILSRRSELRACHEQVAQLERQLDHHNSQRARLEHDCANLEELAAAARAAVVDLSIQLTHVRQQTAAAQLQLDHAEQQRQHARQQLDRCQEHLAANRDELQSTSDRLAAARQASLDLQTQMHAHQSELAAAQERFAAAQIAATEHRIAAARCDERVELLRNQLEQAARDQEEKDRAQADTRQRQALRQSQLSEVEANMLAGGQALADLFLQKEQHARELVQLAAVDGELRNRRAEFSSTVKTDRNQLAAVQSQRHTLEVTADRLRHERQTLCQRLQDDYQIDLAAVASGDAPAAAIEHEPASSAVRAAFGDSFPNQFDRAAAEQEITDLRNQLSSLGAVNVDALDEIDELEARFNRLSTQHRDLADAKTTLERVIQRINADTRQIFVSTLETVRGHFQELFRQLFGGGEADIVLESQEDVLECGIDIVARPPGKEACSISLLSGGEKTLTCVALLLAVFRSKPSPFCVLDEVDAALDEANIGRFVAVLRDFLSFTQFVIVTHSKKTMSGGDTLYGITMEESGVSKRVAVRFEDVSEDGHILPALGRAA